jgi:hypothetical protein
MKVEAMNPRAEGKNRKNAAVTTLYKSWADLQREGLPLPLPLVPAVYRTDSRFASRSYWPYRIEDLYGNRRPRSMRDVIDVRIELDRTDAAIVADIRRLAREARVETPSRGKTPRRYKDWWEDMHPLEVWDLHEHNVPPKVIMSMVEGRSLEEVSLTDIQTCRNSLRTATLYIDQGGWKKIALGLDVNSVP